MSRISVRQTLASAWRFFYRDGANYWPQILLPALVGGIALYTSVYLYLMQLERYLVRPTDQTASVVLGVATGGLLLTLFMHSVVVATVTSLALGRSHRGWKYFRVARRSWRIYAANLRFLLVYAAFLAAVSLLLNGIKWIVGGILPNGSMQVITAAGLFYFVVRIGFLIGPVACAKDHGPIIRESWRLSSRSSWKILLILAIFLVIGITAEWVGELALISIDHHALGQDISSLQVVVANYRAMLPGVLAVIGVAYLVCVVLVTSAAAVAYGQITAPVSHPGPE